MSSPPKRPGTRSALAALTLARAALLALGIATGLATGRIPWAGTATFDGPLPDCRVDDKLTPHRDPDKWALTLLDPEFTLAADDIPPDLDPIDDPRIGVGALRGFVLGDLAAMAAAADAAGESFRVTSAYRSYAHQVRTFDSVVASRGRDEARRSAARPGHSEHQLGTTIDVEGGEAWLAREAWRYGFVVSYPAEHSPGSTCYKAEPWHLRYMGRDAAGDVRSSGLSLRAWLWGRQAGD